MTDDKRNKHELETVRPVKFEGFVDPKGINPNDVQVIDTPDNTYDSWDISDYDNPVAGIGVLDVDHLIGQVFMQTELLGLPERQHNAYKKVIRKMFWDWYNTNLPNPTGLSDVSHQARVYHQIEKE